MCARFFCAMAEDVVRSEISACLLAWGLVRSLSSPSLSLLPTDSVTCVLFFCLCGSECVRLACVIVRMCRLAIATATSVRKVLLLLALLFK